jgi:hypothetical protein
LADDTVLNSEERIQHQTDLRSYGFELDKIRFTTKFTKENTPRSPRNAVVASFSWWLWCGVGALGGIAFIRLKANPYQNGTMIPSRVVNRRGENGVAFTARLSLDAQR